MGVLDCDWFQFTNMNILSRLLFLQWFGVCHQHLPDPTGLLSESRHLARDFLRQPLAFCPPLDCYRLAAFPFAPPTIAAAAAESSTAP